MSPGPAAGLRLADGRQVFVKAVSAEVRQHNHRMILQESEILDVLPESVPAPRRLATVERGPWVVLATTWAPGATEALWTDASITAVAKACRTASGHQAPAALPPVAQRIFDFDGWTRAATVPDTVMPSISTWRRARSAALRPLVTRLIADLRD